MEMKIILFLLALCSLSLACSLDIDAINGNDTSDCLIGKYPCRTLAFPLNNSKCNLHLKSNLSDAINITSNHHVTIDGHGYTLNNSNFFVEGNIRFIFRNAWITNCNSTCFNTNTFITYLEIRNITCDQAQHVCVGIFGDDGISSVYIIDSNFTNNWAIDWWTTPAVFYWASNTSLFMDNCQFIGNRYDGAFVALDGSYSSIGSINISNCLFRDNYCHQSGAAMYLGIDSIPLLLENLTFINNTATHGGIIGEGFTHAIYRNILLINNTGNGMDFLRPESSELHNVTIIGNKGDGINTGTHGGGAEPLYLENVLIADNTGFGIYCEGTPLNITNSQIYDPLNLTDCTLPNPNIPTIIASNHGNSIILEVIVVLSVLTGVVAIIIMLIHIYKRHRKPVYAIINA